MSTGEATERSRVGTTLRGKYRLERVLGSGGVATVYAATHRNKKRFAVKMLHPELSAREDIRERFLREGYAANSVGHPGVVNVLDDDTGDDGAAFLVMELLEGSSVEQLREARGGRLAARVVLAIAEQVLDVLAVAHAMGIVHRDIKPENLFVTQDGHLKVLDFGIARVLDLAQDVQGSSGTPVIVGTPLYMSPEQAAGLEGETEPRTDLWSVGATMFTLLSGRTVHDGDTLEQVAYRAATTPAASLATVCSDAPAGLVTLVDRALAFKKDDRWSSAWEMRDEVRALRVKLFGDVPIAQVLATALPVAASDLPPSSRGLPFAAMPRIPGPARVPQIEAPAAPVEPVPVPPPQPSAPVTLDADASSARLRPVGPEAARLTTMKRAAAMVAVGLALGIAIVATCAPGRSTQAPGIVAAAPAPQPTAPPAPVVVDPPSSTTLEETAAAPTVPEVAAEDLPQAATPTQPPPMPMAPAANPKPVTTASAKPSATQPHATPRRDDGF